MVPVIASDPASRLFVFGLGYSARVFAQPLWARDWCIARTMRSPKAATALRAEGIEALLFDRERPQSDAAAVLA